TTPPARAARLRNDASCQNGSGRNDVMCSASAPVEAEVGIGSGETGAGVGGGIAESRGGAATSAASAPSRSSSTPDSVPDAARGGGAGRFLPGSGGGAVI